MTDYRQALDRVLELTEHVVNLRQRETDSDIDTHLGEVLRGLELAGQRLRAAHGAAGHVEERAP